MARFIVKEILIGICRAIGLLLLLWLTRSWH